MLDSPSNGAASALEPVDAVEVTLLVDNFVDLLMAGSEGVTSVRRRELRQTESSWSPSTGSRRWSPSTSGGTRSSLLYDAGMTPGTLGRNLDVLEVAVKELRAIVISHGHCRPPRRPRGVISTVRAPQPPARDPSRGVAGTEGRLFPTGTEVRLPPPSRNDLEREGVEVVKSAADLAARRCGSRVGASRTGHAVRARLPDSPGPLRRRMGT